MRLTAPRGWELIRIEPDPAAGRLPNEDMEAIANAVREEAPVRSEVRQDRAQEYVPAELAGAVGEGINRGHLRAVPGVLPGMDS